MSSKSQNWLTGDVGKALLHSLPALAFILFMINISNNNQSQVSSSQNNYTETVSKPILQPTESPSQSNVLSESSQYGASQSSKLTEEERRFVDFKLKRAKEQYEFSQRNPRAYRATLEQSRRMNEDAQLRRNMEDALMNSSFNNNENDNGDNN